MIAFIASEEGVRLRAEKVVFAGPGHAARCRAPGYGAALAVEPGAWPGADLSGGAAAALAESAARAGAARRCRRVGRPHLPQRRSGDRDQLERGLPLDDSSGRLAAAESERALP